jgi:hypothetical protein
MYKGLKESRDLTVEAGDHLRFEANIPAKTISGADNGLKMLARSNRRQLVFSILVLLKKSRAQVMALKT